MLGDYDDALAIYREADAALRGDALLALGWLTPLLETASMPHPWNTLWQAYRCHALCLAGRVAEAVGQYGEARTILEAACELTHRHGLPVLAADVLAVKAELADARAEHAQAEAVRIRSAAAYVGPARPRSEAVNAG